MPQVLDYLRCIMPCYMFQMWSMIGLFIIRLDGSPRYAMWCNIIPAALNVVLDWLFIFPLGMGVKGAAIATSTSIIVGGIMALGYLLFMADTLRLVPLKLERGADNTCHGICLSARLCPARSLFHPPTQATWHRGHMACNAGSGIHYLCHHIGLLPQKKKSEGNGINYR